MFYVKGIQICATHKINIFREERGGGALGRLTQLYMSHCEPAHKITRLSFSLHIQDLQEIALTDRSP